MPSLGTLRDKTKRICSIQDSNTTYDSFIENQIDFAQDDFASETNWKYLEKRGSDSSSTFKFRYSLPDDCDVIKAVIWEHDHYLTPVNHDAWIRLNLSENYSTNPRNYIVLGGSLYLWPKPDHSAPSPSISSAITASGASITFTNISGFEDKGRFIIDSEVIEYANVEGNTAFPCLRGMESTAPASHVSGTACTLRNIEYDYYAVLSSLTSSADVSKIPKQYHRALSIYASAQWFYKMEDINQGDRYLAQYAAIKEQAKRDLGERQAQEWTSALDDTPAESFRQFDPTTPNPGSLEYL